MTDLVYVSGRWVERSLADAARIYPWRHLVRDRRGRWTPSPRDVRSYDPRSIRVTFGGVELRGC